MLTRELQYKQMALVNFDRLTLLKKLQLLKRKLRMLRLGERTKPGEILPGN